MNYGLNLQFNSRQILQLFMRSSDTISAVVTVGCTGVAQPLFGGSVSSVGFAQLAPKNAGQSAAVFGSISSMSGQKPSLSSAFQCSADTSSVFGSDTAAVGFADLVSSGSASSGFSKKSG